MRILRTGIINGAKTLNIDDQIGSIEVGTLADIIVFDRDPPKDLRNSNSAIYTIVNGRIYDAQTMDELDPNPSPRGQLFWETGRDNLNEIDW